MESTKNKKLGNKIPEFSDLLWLSMNQFSVTLFHCSHIGASMNIYLEINQKKKNLQKVQPKKIKKMKKIIKLKRKNNRMETLLIRMKLIAVKKMNNCI